jgi:hypothetical protein
MYPRSERQSVIKVKLRNAWLRVQQWLRERATMLSYTYIAYLDMDLRKMIDYCSIQN